TKQLLAQLDAPQPKLDTRVLQESFQSILQDSRLDPAFVAETLTLPSESYLGEQLSSIDPVRIHQVREQLRCALATKLADSWLQTYMQHSNPTNATAAEA